jgi:hypothetical protein
MMDARTVAHMSSSVEDEGAVARLRVAAWVQLWIKEKMRRDGIEVTKRELEIRLGVGRGTASRLLNAERLGLDVFLKVRALLGRSADSLLDDNPPGWNHRTGWTTRT